jgi:hypothetical protein
LALEAAQTRIQQLEAQSAELQTRLVAAQNAAALNGSGIGSGIGSGVGGGASGFLNAGTQNWGRAPETPKPPTASMVSAPMSANRPVGVTSATQPVAAQASASAWGGGLMAQVATTAAGVVAGGLLFQGIQSLMGHSAPSSHSPTAKATEEPAPESMAQEHPAGEVADAGDAGDAGDMSWDMGEDWAWCPDTWRCGQDRKTPTLDWPLLKIAFTEFTDRLHWTPLLKALNGQTTTQTPLEKLGRRVAQIHREKQPSHLGGDLCHCLGRDLWGEHELSRAWKHQN